MTLGTMNHDSDKDDLIQVRCHLEPLVHQVSGHSSMFVLDDVTVCKPLIGREYRFYRTLPQEMKKYTPEFHGTLQVVLQEVGDGLSLAALPNEQMPSLKSNQRALKHGYLRRVSSSSVELESEGEEEEPLSSPQSPSSPSSTANTTSARNESLSSLTHPETHNPWLQQCHQTTLHKLKQKSDPSNVVECIMLENLTFKFRYPCVLDLKMGTRQYGDDAPESKRKSQTAKAANTTTITLGVRLAGMQVYSKEKKRYHCKNKYYGQKLSEEGFKETLWQFLHNGHRLRLDIAELIISKLEELRAIISKLDSVRFFTSSLLIIYDGYDPYNVKLHQRERECEREREGKDAESNRVKMWPESRADDGNSPRDNWPPKEPCTPSLGAKHPAYMREAPTTGGGKAPREQISRNEGEPPYKAKGRYRNRNYKPPIDIRLIDFAHSTHKGMGDSKVYSGPDEGIMLGLDSLTKIFTDIRESFDH
ncbi:inositol hexakisphosphate kinase 3-like isoform X1 [Homarus americanus]|uniref:inositol hexakisphosphate kinase 3-like isoform X1 n=1 Tax=Homarus americanus TaxID=6706 RepID=UPI001C450D9E|nr:inositol hexakisphosphate kinase 3-like isoform X1 [Homarus americanus]XP_042215533.1 inositol hexakisphosphate kinase 3-like isoform X1 [Homarus americanus]